MYAGFRPNEPNLDYLWEYAAKHGLPVLLDIRGQLSCPRRCSIARFRGWQTMSRSGSLTSRCDSLDQLGVRRRILWWGAWSFGALSRLHQASLMKLLAWRITEDWLNRKPRDGRQDIASVENARLSAPELLDAAGAITPGWLKAEARIAGEESDRIHYDLRTCSFPSQGFRRPLLFFPSVIPRILLLVGWLGAYVGERWRAG